MNEFRKRSRARKFALQALYQWHINPSSAQKLIDQFRVQHEHAKVDWILFSQLISKTIQHTKQLEDSYAIFTDREINSLDMVERQLLTLATCELTYHPETPARSLIDDAVHLAKSFGAEDSYKFINAVLDNLARSMPQRQHEFALSVPPIADKQPIQEQATTQRSISEKQSAHKQFHPRPVVSSVRKKLSARPIHTSKDKPAAGSSTSHVK